MAEAGKPLIQRIYALSRPLRERRMRRFRQRFSGTILDVGGTLGTWKVDGDDVTVVNLTPPKPWDAGSARFVVGDGRHLDFADSSFDVVYCNSVVEHVGTFDDQAQLAHEIRRVGKGYWVQTPAKSFPVEPHVLTPFIHWLPRGLQRRLMPYTIWGLITHPSDAYIDDVRMRVRLVSKRELERLFPDAATERESFLGLTKSWIAVRANPESAPSPKRVAGEARRPLGPSLTRAVAGCSPLRPRVVIFYKSIAQYRRRFYELLRERLAEDGIELEVFYGEPVSYEQARRDRIDLPWANKTRLHSFVLAGHEVIWQPGLTRLRRGDLVIVEQASKLLLNYLVFALQRLGLVRMAYWGHGRTTRAHQLTAVGERAKAYLSRRVWWWFAYNERSAGFVRALGYPDDRITRVQNAIDTAALAAAAARVDDEQLASLRAELGVVGGNVCIFVGAMYADKRLPFLLEACELIRRDVPDFEIIFVGDGPESAVVREAADHAPWIHYVGARFDDGKVPYFLLAKLALTPGGVGLGVLDAAVLDTPTVTTDVSYQGPEIEYLHDGASGLVVTGDPSPAAYADAVASVLRDDALLEQLRQGCRESRQLYSIEDMVANFAAGVRAALAVPQGGRG